MRQRILILAVALAVVVSATGTLCGQGSPCLICNRHAQGGWFCDVPDLHGYHNCSPTPHGCANWEPLCETEYIPDVNCYWMGSYFICYVP